MRGVLSCGGCDSSPGFCPLGVCCPASGGCEAGALQFGVGGGAGCCCACAQVVETQRSVARSRNATDDFPVILIEVIIGTPVTPRQLRPAPPLPYALNLKSNPLIPAEAERDIQFACLTADV